jgi:methyl-accepting chemotaxis protein
VAPDVRTWAAAGTSLVLLALGILIAVLFISRIGSDATNLTERQVRYATALSGAAINAKAIANDERGFLLSGNEEFLSQIDVRTEVARDAFLLAVNAVDGAQRQRILEAYEAFELWLVAMEDGLAQYQAGDHEGAQEASLGPTRELRKSYESMLATAGLIQSGIPSPTATVSAATTWAIMVLLGFLVVATAIGLLVTTWAVSGRWPGRS